jgi:high-affinity Fe2+/Pb2+ permease
VATAGFLIYVADAMGYIGSVALLLYRSLGSARLSWVDFFQRMSLVTAAVCAVLFVVSARYFARATTARHRS